MLGFLKALSNTAQDSLQDSAILSEANVQDISNMPRYAGKTWAEVKADLINNNPLVSFFAQFGYLKNIATNIVGVFSLAFLSIKTYKNPFKAIQEDFKTIFKGAGVAITMGALFAIIWKLALIYIAFKQIKGKK